MAAGMFINSVACHNFKEQDDDTADAFIDTNSFVEGPCRVEDACMYVELNFNGLITLKKYFIIFIVDKAQ